MKEIFFLTGLPRAGNTIFGSMINQNKNIKVSANTVLSDVIYKINMLKEEDIFNNFPDHSSLDNIINNVFYNYYKDWKSNYIIDRGAWGTPANLFFLKKIIKNPKFIILYRPVLECLASLIKIEKPNDIESRCHALMQINEGKYGYGSGILAKSIWSMQNIIKNKENYIIVHYKDLIKNPKKEFKKISNFINVPLFFNNKLKKFNINGIEYNDDFYKVDYHKINTKKLKHSDTEFKKILPKNIIQKYRGMDIC